MKTIKLFINEYFDTTAQVSAWAVVLQFNENKKILSGYLKSTDSNRLELMAVIAGIGALKESCIIEIISSQNYVLNSIQKDNLKSVAENNWMVNGTKYPNDDLWKMLFIQQRVKKHNIKFVKANELNLPVLQVALNAAKESVREYIQKNSIG